jgi:hypothetical protein
MFLKHWVECPFGSGSGMRREEEEEEWGGKNG